MRAGRRGSRASTCGRGLLADSAIHVQIASWTSPAQTLRCGRSGLEPHASGSDLEAGMLVANGMTCPKDEQGATKR